MRSAAVGLAFRDLDGVGGAGCVGSQEEAKPLSTPHPAQHLFAGGIAGTTAALITCPLDVIKTRLQSSEFRTLGKMRAHQVAREIIKTEG